MVVPAGIEASVLGSWERSFAKLLEYTKAVVRDLKTGQGVVLSDTANLQRIDQTIRTLEAQAYELGYQDSLQEAIDGYTEIRSSMITEAPGFGLPSSFSKESETAIRMLLEGAETDMVSKISEQTNLIRDVLRRSITGVMQVDDIILALEATGKSKTQALTEINTSMHSFNSQIGVMHAKEAGVTEFVYLGPMDDLTRFWCQHWVGRRDTMANFEATSNQWKRSSLPGPVAVFRGGWNCRHRFVPALTPRFKKMPKGHT